MVNLLFCPDLPLSPMRISRKLLLCLSLSACFIPTLRGQNLSDSVLAVYQNYLLLQQQNEALRDSLMRVRENLTRLRSQQGNMTDSLGYLNRDVKQVNAQLSGLNADLSSSLSQVQRLTEIELLSEQARLRTRKAKIVNTARFIRAALTSYDAIAAQLATSDYLSDVGTLNSPTNKELGFSLNDEILRLLDEQIIKNNPKFNDKNPDKFKEVVTAILESPITTAVTTSVPALSSIRAVVDLVGSIVVRDKNVKAEEFKQFKASLMKYSAHYEELAQASYDFNSNLDKLKVKTNALGTVVDNYSLARVQTLKPNAIPAAPPYQIRDLVFAHYRADKLDGELDIIITEYRSGPREIAHLDALSDRRLAFPLYALTQAQFIQQELESIANQYISTYQLYHTRLKEILVKSKQLSKDPSKVDKKIKDLDEKLEALNATFRRSVKLREVNRALQEIPTY